MIYSATSNGTSAPRHLRPPIMWDALVAILALTGCGSGASGARAGSPPPSLAIKSMEAFYGPNSPLNLRFAIAGQAGFTLLVDGTGFDASPTVEWNRTLLPTTLGDSTDLSAVIAGTLIAVPGAASVTVHSSDTASAPATLWMFRSKSPSCGSTWYWNHAVVSRTVSPKRALPPLRNSRLALFSLGPQFRSQHRQLRHK